MSSSGVRLMEPISAEPAAEEPAAEPRPPRLSIFHLLCWTAGTAIVLNCYRAYALPADPTRATLIQLYMLVSSIANGLAIASLLLFVRYAFRTPTVFPRQPGHWFLVCGGLQCLFGWPAYFLMRAWLTQNPIGGPMPLDLRAQLIQSLISCAVGCPLAIVAIASMSERAWRGIWYFWLVQNVFELLVSAAMFAADVRAAFALYQFWIAANAGISGLFLLALCVVVRRYRQEPRDWLHFAGVGVAVAFFASGPIYYLLDALFVRER